MQTWKLDKEERKKLEAGWNAQDKPQVVFGWYLVYEYDFVGYPYVIGYNEKEKIEALLEDFRKKPGVIGAEMTDSYPYEIFKIWKDKEKKKKQEPTNSIKLIP